MKRKSFCQRAYLRLPVLLAISCFAFVSNSFSQEIPIGTWRMHISFNAIQSVAVSDQRVFGASGNGIMVLDREDKSIASFSKLNGLTSSGITVIGFDQATNQLLIAYEDSKLDVMKDNIVTGLDPLRNTPITGSKKINHLSLHDNLAYFSTDYGVLLFDLGRGEIKETWRDLGPTGETWIIYGSAFKEDSIFLATEKGIMAGDIDDNLLDFANWKRLNTGDFAGPVQTIASFNGKVYAGIDGRGLYVHESLGWTKESFLDGASFQFLNASASHLLIGADNILNRMDALDNLVPVADELISSPQYAVEADNKLWIGDGMNGLVSNDSGPFQRYIPNGPAGTSFRLAHNDKMLFSVPGGYSSTLVPLGNAGVLDKFETGIWSSTESSVSDITHVVNDQNSSSTYLASFGAGIEKRSGDDVATKYDNTNSPLQASGGLVKITALENSDNGLWVANYGVVNSLHLLKSDDTWESVAPAIAAARYPIDLAVDFSQYVWMIPNPAQGGGIFVYDRETGGYEYLTESEGGGDLPSKNVYSIALDRDGLMWVGTDKGAAYFFSPTDDAVKPIFENRFLLRDDKVTAIAVDGGNRKWMGTERGVWLFSPNGEELVYNFTVENSPLLSNVIRDIEINPQTGEVFFATDKGLVSFRSDATESDFSFGNIRIFPNPVMSNFSGTVGISGLATDAVVKITDISGKMIWQTQANGGTATWNVRDYNGRRAATGIYLVFAATQDGVEGVVGKIAILD